MQTFQIRVEWTSRILNFWWALALIRIYDYYNICSQINGCKVQKWRIGNKIHNARKQICIKSYEGNMITLLQASITQVNITWEREFFKFILSTPIFLFVRPCKRKQLMLSMTRMIGNFGIKITSNNPRTMVDWSAWWLLYMLHQIQQNSNGAERAWWKAIIMNWWSKHHNCSWVSK